MIKPTNKSRQITINHSLSRLQNVLVISCLICTTLANSISTDLLTVEFPRITSDLQLPYYLLLWQVFYQEKAGVVRTHLDFYVILSRPNSVYP